jgi:threonine/homoserine/homoserine lactone efflux protein
MNEISLLSFLPTGASLWAFLAASLVLAITPGPGVLFIVMRSVGEGRSVGLASVAGVALGNFGNALAAALGLAALFSVSALAFTIVKWVGAGYLIWLGVEQLRGAMREGSLPVNDLVEHDPSLAQTPSPSVPPHQGEVSLRPAASGSLAKERGSNQEVPPKNTLTNVFRDGALVALFNPKTTIFFAAFLPQFMRPEASTVSQAIVLGAVFVLIAAVTDSLYALLASVIAPQVQRGVARARAGKLALGATFIGLGVMTAFSQRPKT